MAKRCLIWIVGFLFGVSLAAASPIESGADGESIGTGGSISQNNLRGLSEERRSLVSNLEQYPKMAERADFIRLKKIEARMVELSKQELDAADQEVGRVKSQIYETQGIIRQRTGRTEVSPESLHATAKLLEEQREALHLDQAGGEARQRAMERAIDKCTADVQDRVQKDAVSKELEKVIKTRQDMLETLGKMAKAGLATPQDEADARTQLADAQLKLVQRQSEVASGGAETLAGLNRELVNLSIAEEERNAKLTYISRRLEYSLQPALDQVGELEHYAAELTRALDRQENAEPELRSVEAAIATDPVPATTQP